jgi:hypothetical protein
MAAHPVSPYPLCPICNQSVDLETCKTDHNGEAVHEDCYFFRVHNFRAHKALNGSAKKSQQRVSGEPT